MRPYTRSLHPNDYAFLPHAESLRAFEADMTRDGVPHREWHVHRLWEYASIMQQLDELGVPADAKIVDLGSGASFFDPYLAQRYPHLCCVDTEKYGDYRWMVTQQRARYGVSLPLFNDHIESLLPHWSDVFDVTLCISTIEHIDDHDAGFREIVRITKPGGLIFITSDYFQDLPHFERSWSRAIQVTPYREAFVLDLPQRFPVAFVGETDLGYCGDFVQNYSFVNVCLRKVA